jgi:uncharacterized cupin superfamily protein
MIGKSSSRNADGVFEPFAASAVPAEEVFRGRFGSRWQALSDFGGGSHVGVILEELPPGMQSNQVHYHMLEEEHVFVLAGTMTVLLDGKSYPVEPGDYVCFPAGQAAGHALLNEGTEPCRYLLIGENNPNEVAVFPESGRVSVRVLGEGYRRSARMDYWEGVDIAPKG